MADTMQAARIDMETREFSIGERPVPQPARGQVRIRVEAAGVCASDIHLLRGPDRPPFLEGSSVTPGHENAGVVEALGEDVEDWEPGDRVTVFAGVEDHGRFLTMGVDFDGGWAEYVVASAKSLIRLPDSISFAQGAILGDAVATPWAAITVTGGVQPGEAVGVWGLGGLGAHAIKLLRFAGAAPIIAMDPLPEARERAIRYGADLAFDPVDPDLADRIREATDGAGLAVAMDFAGHPAVQAQALESLAVRGRLILVGLSFRPFTIEDSFSLSAKQQQIRGHYATEQPLLEQIVRLVELGRLDFEDSISGTFPLADAETAVQKLEAKDGNPIRFVLRP